MKQLREYQTRLVEAIHKAPKTLLAVDMGLGKTIVVLTAAKKLMEAGDIKRVLVVAPLRVATDTWPDEIEEWDHLEGMTYTLVCGTPKQRSRALAAVEEASVTIVNRENLAWLCEQYKGKGGVPWDMLVWDESSTLKAAKLKTKTGVLSRYGWCVALSKHMKRVVLLSGTPTPEGIEGIWGQIFVLDGGTRLGKFKTHFFNRWFVNKGYQYPDWKVKKGSEKEILDLCSDLMYGLRTEDVLTLPDRIDHVVHVQMPSKALAVYEAIKKDLVIAIEEGDLAHVVASNAAVLVGKLAQIASGAVYDDSCAARELHDEKLTALKSIVEESDGQNMLVFYQYRHELERLRQAFPKAVVLAEKKDSVERWNRGEIQMLIAHPASAGHGLNLQHGGHIAVWLGLPWSMDQYLQANKRLHRSGQGSAVQVYHVLSKGTIDEEILSALQGKSKVSSSIITGICERMLKGQ